MENWILGALFLALLYLIFLWLTLREILYDLRPRPALIKSGRRPAEDPILKQARNSDTANMADKAP